ncbi:unnamed protein product [Lymnaea stagnalis]|uniref:Transmembrane protein 26 n=1 Tax=Lymnaea stagnalis TaxID=6523 RepID=A0AAV2I2C0_LYMST
MAQRLMLHSVVKRPVHNSTKTVFVLNGKINLNISLGAEEWCKILEQMLLLILIVGRWLLPKGEITREQLSQLLLVYIGMAADIIELFEAFKENTVRENKLLTIVILALWTASLVQFTFVVTATKSKKSRASVALPVNSEGCCPVEVVISIFISVSLQDAPFLVLRLLLIFRYDVLSYTNIFFTCKNTLVLVLQMYRLYVLFTERPKEQLLPLPSPTPPQSRYLDTVRDVYPSSSSFGDSSVSGSCSEDDPIRKRSKDRKRRQLIRQMTAESAKTFSSSVDFDTVYSHEVDRRQTKSPGSKSKQWVTMETNRENERTQRYKSPNRNKKKSPGLKSTKAKDAETEEERDFREKLERATTRGDKGVGTARKKRERKRGEVRHKVKQFERHSMAKPGHRQSSDSEVTNEFAAADDVIAESDTEGETGKNKFTPKQKLVSKGHSDTSPRSDSSGRRHRVDAGRRDKQQPDRGQDNWKSVKDMRTALAFLNETGKHKTVVLRRGQDGRYVLEDDHSLDLP